MRLCIVDTYYPEVLRAFPIDPAVGYEENLSRLLSVRFGSFDAYSRNLRALGHECMDVIYNHHDLQNMWANENYAGKGRRNELILDLQIETFQPDVVFLQDLSVRLSDTKTFLLAGQCSCPMPREENVRRMDVLFTSFPHYVKRFESLGVRGIYMPLAFEPRMNDEMIDCSHFVGGPDFMIGLRAPRDIDISFVGGVGRNSHWRQGTDVLEAVAAEFKQRFHWFGYGLENLSASSPLRDCYRGTAWGWQMYDVYRRSKIVINRHGEVAQGYTNNLRCFEASGCGALLMTEDSPNLRELFPDNTCVSYSGPTELCDKIKYFLAYEKARETVAAWGQMHTLANHTYAQRMKTVSEVLQEMLCAA